MLKMKASEFIDNMLSAGCVFDRNDPRKLIIPNEVAERAGVLPGYFYISDSVDGVAVVDKFLPDGTQERIQ